MKTIFQYKFILILVLPIVILVIVKAFSNSSFKPDAVKRAAPSFKSENMISWTQLVFPGERLIIDITAGGTMQKHLPKGAVHIPAAMVADRENLKIIRKSRRTVVLASDKPGESAAVWMLLSQMGIEPVFILDNFEDNEVLKYKFQPDSMIRAGNK
jgi:rhodanese-related sulfurtransferase